MREYTPSLDDLRAFVAVAEASGFRRASRNTGVKQSVLSRRVVNMEDALGASLFERNREGVRLTYAGSHFLRDVRPIFARLDSAFRNVRQVGAAAEGCIRVGTVAAISGGFLSQLLRYWRTYHEGVAVQFEAALGQESIAKVVARQLDLAIVTGSPSALEYQTETLWSEDVVIAVSSQHAIAERQSVRLSELRAERFIVMRHPPGPDVDDWIIRRLSDLGSSPEVEEQAVGRETLFSLVGLGFGVTFASSAEMAIEYPNVSLVRVDDEQLPFSFVWSPANDNPALRRFLSEARLLSRRWPDAGIQAPDPATG